MEDTRSRLQEVLDQAVRERFVAGASVLVLQGGKERWFCKSGMRDLENGLEMERDTIFRLYSMTKPVTSAAVMILLERGLLDLGEPVAKFLPGFQWQKVADGRLTVSVRL